MSEELLFKRWAPQPDGRDGQYPVMALRDIEIHFNHYQDVEKATADWIRRRRKINYDNLLVMIYTEQESEVEAFIRLKNFRKICFVPDRINRWKENKDIWGMSFMPGQSALWDRVNYSVCTGKNAYVLNILKMLEGEQIYRYEK